MTTRTKRFRVYYVMYNSNDQSYSETKTQETYAISPDAAKKLVADKYEGQDNISLRFKKVRALNEG